MNKSLRQLFTIVVALFVILGMSTTIIMAIRANQLTNDARNVRAFQRFVLVPAFLFRRRTVCAGHRILLHQPAWLERCRSVPQLAAVGPVGAAALAAVQVTVHRAGEQGRQYRNVHRSEDSAGRIQQPRQHGWRRSGHRAENRPYPRHGQYAQLRPEPAGQP